MRHPTLIKGGYRPLVYCHTSKVPCSIQKIIATLDKKTGAILEYEPECIKQGDAALVELVPHKPMIVEAFSDYPLLGRIVIRD